MTRKSGAHPHPSPLASAPEPHSGPDDAAIAVSILQLLRLTHGGGKKNANILEFFGKIAKFAIPLNNTSNIYIRL